MSKTNHLRMSAVLCSTLVVFWGDASVARAAFVFGEPTKVPGINSDSPDSAPHISRDGLELYFVSTRDFVPGKPLTNIWVARRPTTRDRWSAPVKLDMPAGFAGSVQSPSLTADGLELYFADGQLNPPNPGGYGGSDIWVMKRANRDAPWGKPVNLGPTINTQHHDDTPCISPNGLELYIAKAPNDSKNADLFVATRPTREDPWGEPVSLSPNVNSSSWEYTPWISHDGLSLFFSRGHAKSHIHVSRRATIADPWGPAEFFAPVSSGSAYDVWNDSPGQTEYSLSFADGNSMLYFARGTMVIATDFNIWQVEVIPILDFNGDGAVDTKDLAILIDSWGQADSPCDVGPLPWGDGVVDAADLEVLIEALTTTPGSHALDVPRDVVLDWPSFGAVQAYDVYLGTSLDEVTHADRDNPLGVLVSLGQAETTYEPAGLLEFGQIYYWRIDAVAAEPDAAIYKGFVSKFTTERHAYPLDNVTATCNAPSAEGEGPENTVNGSGLNADGQHSNKAADMWLAKPPADEALSIQYEFDRVYKLHEMLVWNHNTQWEMHLGYGLKDVTVKYSVDGEDWTMLGEVQFAQATGQPDYAANTVVDFGGAAVKYVRLTMNSAWGLFGQYGLSEVQFLYIPTRAWQPQPADGATDVNPGGVLRWRAGREAVAHEVYLATDRQAVVDGLPLVDIVAGSSYQPGPLDRNQTYYWKINEITEADDVSIWEGDVWEFSTGN